MVDQSNNEMPTCRDIEDEAFLQAYGFSEEYHDFQEVDRKFITEVGVCEVLLVVEECSLCSARLPGVVVSGDAPAQMQTYKQLLYDVYEAFYEDPQSHEYIALSKGLANVSFNMQMTIQSELSTVIELGRDDAERGVAKQSEVELWTQVLGQEFGDDE